MEQNCVWLFFYFNFERNYYLLKLKSPCILLSKNINFNENKMELREMRHGFREMNLKVQLTSESQTESKTDELELATEKFFCTVYFVWRKFFKHLCFISMYSILNTLSEYTYFSISKNITSYTFLLVFKIVESLQCILKH